MAILGSIVFGVATPTEASAVGVFGALICAAVNRRLNWTLFRESGTRTLSTVAMVMWVVFGASCFAMVYQALGAVDLITAFFSGLEVNRWVILIMMQISFFFLGCVLNSWAILMLTLPVYLPIIDLLGFNQLWFGILFVVNMEMALLTPPFGFTMFLMKAVAPQLSMSDLYRSIIPFVGIQALCLAIVMLFPMLAIWLPNLMFHSTG